MMSLQCGIISGIWVLAFAGIGSELGANDMVREISGINRINSAGSAGSYAPSFSADGKFLVFVSHANNLVTNDNGAPYLDVFVRDLTRSLTRLISINTNNLGGGNHDANFPSISSNGQFVAFASEANNLAPNDTNNASDVFVRDLTADITEIISVDLAGRPPANPMRHFTPWLSGNPRISADGRWAFFESDATNLVAQNDRNNATDVFVRDRDVNVTSLISLNAAGDGTANGASELCGITPDGRRAVIVSQATDLVSGVTNLPGEIFVRDIPESVTIWASSQVGGYFTDSTNGYRCANPALSDDGQWVTFLAAPPDNPTALLFLHDLQSQVTHLIHSNVLADAWPALSADGGRLAYTTATNQSLHEPLNVWVWDRLAASNILANVNLDGTGPGNAAAHSPAIARDGQRVGFLSAATNLAPQATNGSTQVFVRDLELETTILASMNWEQATANQSTEVTSLDFSSYGPWIVFESPASNLDQFDLNQANDIFIHQVEAGMTQLVSVRHDTRPAVTAAAESQIQPRSISGDGRIVAFRSCDNNLVAGDTNLWRDMFVKDMVTGEVDGVSLRASVALSRTDTCFNPIISRDGNCLVFAWDAAYKNAFSGYPTHGEIVWVNFGSQVMKKIDFESSVFGPPEYIAKNNYALSSQGNLFAFQTLYGQLYLRDLIAQTNQVISFGTDPCFSPNDRWVFFASTSPDLTDDITDGIRSLFAWDLWSNSTHLVSAGPDGQADWGLSGGPVFSADSRYVVFTSGSDWVTLHDLVTRSNRVVGTKGTVPSISNDGQTLAYATRAAGWEPGQVYATEWPSNLTSLLSVNADGTGGGNGDSSSPLVSDNGRYVVFASKASDLVENDNNDCSDIFVRDRWLGTTLLASMDKNGTGSGNAPSSNPVMAANGITVIFHSFADNLIGGDFNYKRDVFILQLNNAPSDDGDGMDDDWELAYFNTLTRDGTGDFDQDGFADSEEFRAGTDPTNAGSVLQVLKVTSPGSGNTTIIWRAVPGLTYQVQFKDTIAEREWKDIPDIVTANGSTGVVTDLTADAQTQRYYRVVLVP